MKSYVLILTAFFMFISAMSAETVVVNSLNGLDVLSGAFYANVVDASYLFVPLRGSTPDIIASRVGEGKDVLLIQPVDSSVYGSLRLILESHNNNMTVYSPGSPLDSNLYLAKLSGAHKFIIVDPSYADSALSVASYAKYAGYYVLFADRNNVGNVTNYLSSINGTDLKVVIFGYVDPAVKSSLSSFNTERWGSGLSKYRDNLFVVNKTLREFSLEQVVLTTGESIELGSIRGKYPLLFVGSGVIPNVVRDFITRSVLDDVLSVGVLIDYNMIPPVQKFRDDLNKRLERDGHSKFGVIIKYGQILPGKTGVYGLDRFPVPTYHPSVTVSNLTYNVLNKDLMVTVKNKGEGPAYYLLDVRVLLNGVPYKSFYVNSTRLIDAKQISGILFSADFENLNEGNLSAVTTLKYGAREDELDSLETRQFPLLFIRYIDTSLVNITGIKYSDGILYITLKNNGNVTAYAHIAVNISRNNKYSTVESSDVIVIKPGSSVVNKFPVKISGSDLSKPLHVLVDYGGKPGFMDKRVVRDYVINKNDMCYLLPVLILAILILIYMYSKGRKKNANDGR